MSVSLSNVESAYRDRMDAMAPYERVARSAALFEWTRQQIARQIIAEHGCTDAESWKWLVALRLYGSSPGMRMMIEGKLTDVPG